MIAWLLVLAIAVLPSCVLSAVGAEPDLDAKAKPAAVKAKAADDSSEIKAETPPVRVPPNLGKVKLKVGPSSIAVIDESGRRQTLSIHYRWRVHANASVEVRLIPGESRKGVSVVPVYFRSEYFTPAVSQKVYHCLDRAADAAPEESFSKDKMTFKIVGARNSLGNPAVYVLPYNEGGNPADRPGAVFLELASWAVNDSILSLDLPHDVFTKSGTLVVWFLRGSQIVWEEKVPWPGYR
jgi:hypothetical protein